MKRHKGKPRYIRHFVKAFIPCMIAAVLIGMVGTAGLYGIHYKSVSSMNTIQFNETERELHDKDITQMTSEEIREILARNTRVAEDDSVDRAFLLERKDTGERLDSAVGLYADCKIQWNLSMSEYYAKQEAAKYTEQQDLCFVCADEAFQAMSQKMEEVRSKNPNSDYLFRIRIKDIYVRKDSRTFQPGIVEYVRIPLKKGLVESIDTLDLTPADQKDLVRLSENNNLVISRLGSPVDSLALAKVRDLDENDYSHHNRIPKRNEPVDVIEHLVSPEGDASIQWILREVCYYHFWKDAKAVLLQCYALLLFLTILTAAVIAIFTTMRDRKICEMEQYRRKLTNTLAHDLRSPLTAIVGYLENLRSNVNPDKQEYYMDAILKNTACMDNMISDVLELSVLERTKDLPKERVELMELFADDFARYEPELQQKHITLRTEGACTVYADHRMMAQAAANLVSNAVRYTPEDGTITVSGSIKGLTVANTCGEIDHAEKLLEPFAKADKARSDHSGTGLGLTIVRQIMELHGFRFGVCSKDGVFTAEMRC